MGLGKAPSAPPPRALPPRPVLALRPATQTHSAHGTAHTVISRTIRAGVSEVIAEKFEAIQFPFCETDQPVGRVRMGHSVTACQNFQSVVTIVEIELPFTGPREEGVKAAQAAFNLVEECHTGRVAWVKSVLETLGEAKIKAEGR